MSFCFSCSTVAVRIQPQQSWSGPLGSGYSRFNQSCGAACTTPVNASTGEFVAPTVTRLGPVVEKVVQVAETVQGLLTVERLLTEAEFAEVEAVVEQCVAQAHADVNETYQKQKGGFKFENGKFPSDAECGRTLRIDEQGEKVTLAQELGLLKHAAAFACIRDRLPRTIRGNFSTEPRYKGEPEVNGVVLTNNKANSLKPDLVVHATRNATNIQCVLEFKFPCYERHRLEPMRSPGVVAQLESYMRLSKDCRVSLVTPSGIKPYEGK
ncbi:hypothetical protein D187_001617 [Cystobacter fuscus DSM 2262]|uniref:Uncharacterized protein n=1 Tax=Cystobacter fuscus (strain ATCC 25194 / DSM 2262 / NBRC 100088 / M29) TaxID=1242864 RepID=S9P962_CYSF2|nr:hypothetical protein D187_001617 [Cystobacter fuscus DSM 2262]